MNAVNGGHNEIAQLLVNNGVDVNAKDDRGQLPKNFNSYLLPLNNLK